MDCLVYGITRVGHNWATFTSLCCCSVVKMNLTLCSLTGCSMPGFPVLHYLQEFAQIHVELVISLTISFSAPFSSCPQSSPASGSFPMSWLFTSGGQSVGASASVLPMNIQDWFPLGLTVLISFQSPWILKSLLQHHNWKASVLQLSAFFMIQLSHLYMTTGKTIALTVGTLVSTVMCLLFNMLSSLL